MSPAKRPWWRAFDRVERKVGKPLEDAVASSAYMEVMVRGMKVQRAVGGAVGRVAAGAVGKALRVAQLPTRSDVRRISREITALTSEVRALKLAQQQAESSSRAAAKPALSSPEREAPRDAD
jgi:hypothetical protein